MLIQKNINDRTHRIKGLGSLPEHELQLAEGSPPDPSISGLQLWLPLVEEVGEVGGDGQQVGLGRHPVVVLPVPLVQQVDVIAHPHQGLPEHQQLRRVNLRRDRPVPIPWEMAKTNAYF